MLEVRFSSSQQRGDFGQLFRLEGSVGHRAGVLLCLRHGAEAGDRHRPRAPGPQPAEGTLRQRPPVPCTSLYSKDDGLVRWQQCVAACAVSGG